MITALLLASGSVVTTAPILASQQVTEAQVLDSKLQGGLLERLASAQAGELIPVDIVLRDQVPAAQLKAVAANQDKSSRRAEVIAILRGMAEATQPGLLAMLEAERATGGVGGEVRSLWIANVVSAQLSPAVIQRIAARSDVSYVHYDPPRKAEDVLLTMPTAQATAGTPTCGLNLIGAPQTWSQLGVTGRSIVVAVCDTGVCATHPDIAGQIWKNAGEVPGNGIDDDANGFVDDVTGWNFEGNNANNSDNNGHGSHTSGTIAGDGTGGIQCGVAPDARIMMLKFVNSLSTGEQSVWSSMQYAVANGADVFSASLGWPHSFNPNRATWRQVCDNSIAAGVVVVYASGNEGCGAGIDNVRTPGDVPNVIAVGAVDCSDAIAGFSSCGPVSWSTVAPYNDFPFPPGLMKPDVSAPGVATTSHSLCSSYMNLDGTSMATPHVAGLAALILEADPTLDHFGVRAILESTSLDLGLPGKDKQFGTGRVRAVNAVQAALANGNYCGAKVNSCGTLPMLTMAGTPSASATGGFIVSASNTSGGQIGLLIYTDAGPANVPFLGGRLCLNGVKRTVPVPETTGTPGQCNGTLAIDMNLFRAGFIGGNPSASLSVPGTQIRCQFWGRDSAGTFGSLLSSGMDYIVCP
jgi:subtilisin family serine protease